MGTQDTPAPWSTEKGTLLSHDSQAVLALGGLRINTSPVLGAVLACVLMPLWSLRDALEELGSCLVLLGVSSIRLVSLVRTYPDKPLLLAGVWFGRTA